MYLLPGTLSYDNVIQFAVGKSRLSTRWQNKEQQWSEFAERLALPTRTPETFSEYNAMAKSRRDEIKDIGGFVGGTLKSGRRKAENVLMRQLLTLDLDEIPRDVDPWEIVKEKLHCAAVMYSTHSHKEKAPRMRLIFPLSRPVMPDEYVALARRVAKDIGIDMCDDTTYEVHRLMYWPSASIDAPYRYEVLDAPWLDADEQLARYTDWRDVAEWPMSSRKHDIIRRLAKKQEDPLEKQGWVGAFCRVYPIEDAIRRFLPSVYVPCDMPGRYTYAAGSTAGGLVIYEDGKFAYSHHGTDPVSGKLCNAFDLVRIHMYGDKDESALPETRGNRLPSYLAMVDLLQGDEEVKKNNTETLLAETAKAFEEVEVLEGQVIDDEWKGKLTANANGTFTSTIDNAFVILTNDPALKGKLCFDEFRVRPVVLGDLPWQRLNTRPSICWGNADDAGLRRYLEKRYGIVSVSKIQDAVELAMLLNKQHPVQDYLNSLTWDGVPRVETLFIDYLGAADTLYVKEVTKRALIGAVARIYQPGCKHDHALVLVGPQGTMKSTILSKLGGKWFSDSLYTMVGKDAYEQLIGAWIIELGEMAAMRKTEVEQIKHFISKQVDNYRAAYARRPEEHPRQCAFFGSTNDIEFLRDATGNRRFWPVVVSTKGRETIKALNQHEIDQVWAEVVDMYNAGEHWYLSEEAEAAAREIQEEHTEVNSKIGVVENFLNVLLPEDWDSRELAERLMFWDGGFGEREEGTVQRKYVCALELWQELFRGDKKAFGQQQARELNGILRAIPEWSTQINGYGGKLYGKQRMFMRKTEDEDEGK